MNAMRDQRHQRIDVKHNDALDDYAVERTTTNGKVHGERLHVGQIVVIERRAEGLFLSVSQTPESCQMVEEPCDAISRLAREGVRVSAAEITAQGGIAGERTRPERVIIDPERLLWAVFFREGMRTSGMGTKDAELIADDATRRAVGTSEGAEKTERIRAMLRAYGADD